MRGPIRLLSLCLSALAAAPGAGAVAAEPAPNARYLVFEIENGALRPVFSRNVHLAAPPRGKSDDAVASALAEASREDELFEVRLVDADGGSLFHDAVAVPRW